MSYRVYVRRAAERDVVEAQKWYEQQQYGLAARFHVEFSATLDRLAETPLIYPALYCEVRRVVLRRFPYLVWYRVQNSSVTVLACTHGRVDPFTLSIRLGKNKL
ncbi:MAG: type II toxin-antitoxin system RelE/ParE family toxin [Immundisolibacter sp.]|uniref:type II toxin-antitoxin system RelE/ParE family toxin n=1 Tax=Immundisolibacter sp. TaxID=1934948 RepID=UPI003EE254C7